MVSIGEVTVGAGKPKICASITEKNTKAIIAAADILVSKRVDIVEWRIDYFQGIDQWEQILETLQRLKMSLCGKPLLVTLRTSCEGGMAEVEEETYREVIGRLAASGFVQAVDIEVFRGISFEKLTDGEDESKKAYEELQEWIRLLQKQVVVIGSYHNFHATPSDEEMRGRMEIIADSGVDILKMAVMPGNKMDVLRLMVFTLEESEKRKKPLITVSMDKIGSISRVAGEAFGSAVTFGSIGQGSAPGQLPVNRLQEMLDVLHQNYQ